MSSSNEDCLLNSVFNVRSLVPGIICGCPKHAELNLPDLCGQRPTTVHSETWTIEPSHIEYTAKTSLTSNEFKFTSTTEWRSARADQELNLQTPVDDAANVHTPTRGQGPPPTGGNNAHYNGQTVKTPGTMMEPSPYTASDFSAGFADAWVDPCMSSEIFSPLTASGMSTEYINCTQPGLFWPNQLSQQQVPVDLMAVNEDACPPISTLIDPFFSGPEMPIIEASYGQPAYNPFEMECLNCIPMEQCELCPELLQAMYQGAQGVYGNSYYPTA